jgi:hypothetical protein
MRTEGPFVSQPLRILLSQKLYKVEFNVTLAMINLSSSIRPLKKIQTLAKYFMGHFLYDNS